MQKSSPPSPPRPPVPKTSQQVRTAFLPESRAAQPQSDSSFLGPAPAPAKRMKRMTMGKRTASSGARVHPSSLALPQLAVCYPADGRSS